MKNYDYEPRSIHRIDGDVRRSGQSILRKKLSVRSLKKDRSGKIVKSKTKLLAIKPKQYAQYKTMARQKDISLSVVGKTKLKLLKVDQRGKFTPSRRCEATLSVIYPDKTIGQYEVCENYHFSRVVGYLPVGNDRFIAVVKARKLLLGIIIILIIATLIGALFLLRESQNEQVTTNRYLEEASMEVKNSNPAQTRYRFNTTMTVVKDTIQDLNFENVNDEKYLRIMIKASEDDPDYIYDSGFVPSGEKVTADVLKKSLEPGTYHTIAECYAYNMDQERTAQTNFEVKLIVK